MSGNDTRFLQRAIAVARQARENGNHPFGAILVDKGGNILLEAENTVVTDKNCTGHAETNLMRQATQTYPPDLLAGCTLYTSTEPCPMCSGAIFWGNVRRVVYGLSQEEFYRLTGDNLNGDVFYHPCRDVFARGQKSIEVVGPLLEDEAGKVHAGFWG
jgi:tRNA(Arg) A34 adenosine deaminase TadA